MNEDMALVANLEAVWRSIERLCESFTEQDWNTPTQCPGWTVQDQVSHVVGTEWMQLGRPAPDHTVPALEHIRNAIGQANELHVDYRRTWPGVQVLEEFKEVTAERLKQLKAMGPEDFEADSWTPTGPGRVRDLIAIRLFDCWVHEQDIRRALSRPGHLSGPVAEHAFSRIAMAMPYVVGKKVGIPDGTAVVFEVTGEAGGVISIVMRGRRAERMDEPPSNPDVVLVMDLESFACLGTGRWTADEALTSGDISVKGDQELGRRILEEMNFMI